MTGISLALLLAAMQTAASIHPPPEAEDLPARAVDHVVMLEDGGSPCVSCFDYRGTMIRSGPWVREEWTAGDYHQLHYSDFDSGTSFSVLRDRVGGFKGLDVRRGSDPRARSGFRREPTGSHDSWLGEPCEIWSITRFRHDEEICETADGIRLWSRRLVSAGGGIFHSIRAVSVERRPVRREEARPAADFFNQIPSPAAAATDDAGAFEVRFVFGRGRDRVEELFRRSGRRNFVRRQSDDGTVEYRGSDGPVTFSYDVDADGRPVRLHFWDIGEDELESRRETWVPVPGRRWRLLFGERCRWQHQVEDERPDEPYQCRTESGIPLMLEARSLWDQPILYRASSLRRGPLEPEAFAIPATATDWTAWGVEPSR